MVCRLGVFIKSGLDFWLTHALHIHMYAYVKIINFAFVLRIEFWFCFADHVQTTQFSKIPLLIAYTTAVGSRTRKKLAGVNTLETENSNELTQFAIRIDRSGSVWTARDRRQECERVKSKQTTKWTPRQIDSFPFRLLPAYFAMPVLLWYELWLLFCLLKPHFFCIIQRFFLSI